MIKVSKDWWKGFFNHIYLTTDARSVCNQELTYREVDLLEKFLGLGKNDRILDLFGGQGRHCIELARRGYQNLTVLDYSDYLVNLGRRSAKKARININFYQGDARSTALAGSDYSVIIIMANSFGYFSSERENLSVLREIKRLLKTEGKLLLDLTNATYATNKLRPNSWHKIGNNIEVYREREINKSLVKTREIVVSDKQGLLRDDCYCERLYTKTAIAKLLRHCGFKKIRIKDGLCLHKNKQDYGLLTSRMFVTAIK